MLDHPRISLKRCALIPRNRLISIRRIRRRSSHLAQTRPTRYQNNQIPSVRFSNRHLLQESSIVAYVRNPIFRSIDFSCLHRQAQVRWYLPEKYGSCLFAAAVLPEIISREREQSTINGSAVVEHSLTAQEHETVWRVSWSGSDESRSTRTDLKGLDQGRCPEGRMARERKWEDVLQE